MEIKKYLWMFLTLAILTFAGGRLMRHALSQVGGNVYDPTGGTLMLPGNNVVFTKVGAAGYQINVSSGAAPNGSPPQVVGYSAPNTSESQTISGDSSAARTAAHTLTFTNSGINGVAVPASKAALATNSSSQPVGATLSGNASTLGTTSGSLPAGHYAGFDAFGNIIDNGTGTSNPAYAYNPASCAISANAMTPTCTVNVAETVCSKSIAANLQINLSTASCAAGQRLIIILAQTAGGLSVTYSNTGVTETWQSNCNASGSCPQPALSGNGNTDVFQFSYDTVPATPTFREVDQALNVTPNFVINPMTTLGDLIYGGASGTPTRLAGPTSNPGVPTVLNETESAGAALAPQLSVLPIFDFPANNATTAPVQNEAAILSTLGVTVATTSTLANQVKGICVNNCATSGSSEIVVHGQVSVLFDGAITQGDYFTTSTSTGGKLHDTGVAFSAGTACPIANGAVGVILAPTNGAPGATPQLVDVDKTLCLAVGELLAMTNSATGTVLNGLISVTGSPSTAVKTSAAATSGAIGICVAGCGTSGTATIITDGAALCTVDGTTIAGDYLGISATVAGDCTDLGSTYPASGQVIGRTFSVCTAGNPCSIDLFDEIQGPFNANNLSAGTVASARGGAGTVNGILQGNGSGTTSAVTVGSGLNYAGGTLSVAAGGPSGTVNSGTAGQLGYYATSSNAISGNANATISNGALTLGVTGSVLGDLILAGSGSGAVTIQPQAAAGTYNFNLPITAGTAGQPLLSGGGGSAAQTYGILSVGAGGTQCGAPTIFASLPGSPTNGEICNITDATACTVGVAVTIGGGSTRCQITYNGTNWEPAGGAAAAGGPPTGTASGGLTGTYPGPFPLSVAQVTQGILTVANGGTQCGTVSTFASLPTAPGGTICTIDDPTQSCSAGTQITSGTGTPVTPTCQVVNLGTLGAPLWYAAGASVASSGGGSSYATKVGLIAQTSITATCSATSGTHPTKDLVWEVLTGTTTYTTPAAASGCIEGDIIEAYFVQGDNQGFQVNLADGAGTNHTGSLLTVPTSTGTAQGYFLHFELEYHTNNTQWEVKSQNTNPLAGSGSLTLSSFGIGLFVNSGISATSVCVGRDSTNPAVTVGFDGYKTGQVTVHAANSDVVQISCGAGGGGGSSGTVAGFNNSPTVLTAGGNATTTLTGSCLSAGCTDFQTVANGTNTGTLTITPLTAAAGAGMTPGEYIFVYVVDTGTAPSDVLFAAQNGVTYQSAQPGLQVNPPTVNNLTGTGAADKLARQNSCGSPPVTGRMIYNFLWDGTNLTLSGCSTTTGSPYISQALIGGAQWASRTVVGSVTSVDPVLATDTVIEDNATGGNIQENLPACNSTNVGKFYIFKKTDTTTGSITLNPFGTDTIDTFTSVVISAPSAEYPIRCSPTAGLWRRGLPIPWVHQYGGTDVTAVGSAGQILTSNGTNFVVASRPVRPGFDFGSCASNVCNSRSMEYSLAEQWTFPAAFTGTYPDATATIAKCSTNPSESDQYTVSCDSATGSACGGTALGTVTISTSCGIALAGAGGGCAAGNTLRVCAPATASGVGIEITLAGHTP